MCKIIFLHLQNIFVEKFILFMGTVFKNAMADGFLINGEYPQYGANQGVASVMGNLKGKPDGVGIIGLKSLVFKGQAHGADIQNKDLFSFEGDEKSPALLKVIPEGMPQVIGVVPDNVSFGLLFFPEQIPPSCFGPCFLPMYWVKGAWHLRIRWRSTGPGEGPWK